MLFKKLSYFISVLISIYLFIEIGNDIFIEDIDIDLSIKNLSLIIFALIIIGFIIFAFGSFVGYQSSSIYSIILARFLQGAGAIGSVSLALTYFFPSSARNKL